LANAFVAQGTFSEHGLMQFGKEHIWAEADLVRLVDLVQCK